MGQLQSGDPIDHRVSNQAKGERGKGDDGLGGSSCEKGYFSMGIIWSV